MTAFEANGCFNASIESKITINTPITRNTLLEETIYYELLSGRWFYLDLDLESLFNEPDSDDVISLEATFTNCGWLEIYKNKIYGYPPEDEVSGYYDSDYLW